MLNSVAEQNLDIWNLLTNKGCYLQASPIVEKQVTCLRYDCHDSQLAGGNPAIAL